MEHYNLATAPFYGNSNEQNFASLPVTEDSHLECWKCDDYFQIALIECDEEVWEKNFSLSHTEEQIKAIAAGIAIGLKIADEVSGA